MFKWLSDLLKGLFDEEDSNTERDQKRDRETATLLSTRQAQARTKNIYPRDREREQERAAERDKQRQFRFPVIPDTTANKSGQREKISQERKEPEKAKRHEPPAFEKKNNDVLPKWTTGSKSASITSSSPLREEKHSFKPTEIFSPIYGKIEDKVEKRNSAPITSSKESTSFPKMEDIERSTPPPTVPQAVEEVAAVTEVPVEKIAVMTEEIIVENEGSFIAEPEELVVHEEPVVQATVPVEEEQIPKRVLHALPMFTNELVDTTEPVPITEPTVIHVPEVSFTREENKPNVETSSSLPQSNLELANKHAEVLVQSQATHATYDLPSIHLLTPSPALTEDHQEYTLEQKRLLEETLSNFSVNAQVVGIVKGPSVTRFELQPAPGVKVNKITGLSDDIKLNLAAKDIRIEAPIPGRNAVGIEVPNLKSEPIFISRIIGSQKFMNHPSPLAIALGMDIGGEPIVADIKKMPHGLIAGSTGSGKSVCINSIIVSLLYKATPEQVRLLLIDPKMVELAPYNHLPHLVTPVITEAKQATAALKWAVEEMEKRYTLFVDAGVRDIERYNQTTDEPLPYIVIIIDELADLMMVSPQDVEDCIIRIAQKARACGIHLLLATQRPSVDVITGNIKANVPTRLAFAVFSQIDSRTILDQSGAERLLGRGDMLFLESGATPIRLQGNYVSDEEIESVTQMIKKQRKPEYIFSKEDLESTVQSYDMGDDPLFFEALLFVSEQGQASASGLQRRFRVGYNRAARLIDMMEAEGYVTGQSGGKPRSVLITREDVAALAEGTSLL